MRLGAKLPAIVGGLAVLLSFGAGTAAATPTPSLSDLQSAATTFLASEVAARHWTIDTQSLTQLSSMIEGDTIKVQYLVTQKHLLDYGAVNDVPVMKGLLGEQAQMTPAVASSAALVGYINEWQSNLASYISTPQLSHEELQVTASLDSNGDVEPSTVQVFELADENGDWVSAATDLI